MRALRAVQEDDEHELARSKMPALRSWLDENLLASARELKEDAGRQKVAHLLADAAAAHEEFVATAKAQFEVLRALREDAIGWVHGPLAAVGTSASDTLQLRLEKSVSKLADDIAAKSTSEAAAPLPVISGLASGLLHVCREEWQTFATGLLDAYDEQFARILAGLTTIEGEHWQGVLDSSMTELRVEAQSWRKDLQDYMEQVERYAEGFIEGQGVGMAVWCEVETGSHHRPQVIRPVLTEKLAFLSARADRAVQRWTAELSAQMNSSFGKLERQMQVESAAIQNQGYRRVEGLQRWM